MSTLITTERLRISTGEERPEDELASPRWLIPVTLAVMALAFLEPGVLRAFSLSSHLSLLIDAAVAGFSGAAVFTVLNRRLPVTVPIALVAYVGWALAAVAGALAIGTHSSIVRDAIAGRNMLLGPLLAVALATMLAEERESRSLLLGAIALCGLEFLIGMIQFAVLASQLKPGLPIRALDTDKVVAALEVSANWAVGLVSLIGSCLCLAAGLVRRRGWYWFLAAFALPQFCLWAVVKAAVIILPPAGIAILAVYAWLASPIDWRKLLAGALALAAGTGAIVGGYAIWYPDSFEVLFNASARAHYLTTGDLAKPLASSGQSGPELFKATTIGGWSTKRSDWTSPGGRLSAAGRAGPGIAFVGRVRTTGASPYQGVSSNLRGRYRQGMTYSYYVYLSGKDGGERVNLTFGVTGDEVQSLFPLTTTLQRYSVAWAPKANHRRAGIAIRTQIPAAYTWEVEALRRPIIASQPTPGHVQQFRDAWHLVRGGAGSVLFGKGLGAATYGQAAGVTSISPRYEEASLVDANTLLVEGGLVGLGAAALAAVALLGTTLAPRSRLPQRSWRRIAVVAYPGVFVTMAIGALYATPFREKAVSLLFWVLTAVAISPVVSGGVPLRLSLRLQMPARRSSARR